MMEDFSNSTTVYRNNSDGISGVIWNDEDNNGELDGKIIYACDSRKRCMFISEKVNLNIKNCTKL
mgnify:CR=1 FL=1